jgi:hypothetical protein
VSQEGIRKSHELLAAIAGLIAVLAVLFKEIFEVEVRKG